MVVRIGKRTCVRQIFYILFGTCILIYLVVFLTPSTLNTIRRIIPNVPDYSIDIGRHWLSDEGKNMYYWQPDPYAGNRSCKIPKIYPYEPESIKLIQEQTVKKHLTPPQCEVNPTALFKTDQISSLIWIGRNIGSDSWIDNRICCYTPYTAIPPKYDLTFSHTCTEISSKVTLIPKEHENIRVTCFPEGDRMHMTFRDYLHFFRLNGSAEEILEKREYNSHLNVDDFLSVIYFGLDSVAFTNFQRFLPKSREFLVRNLSAIEFTGLNKVGRGTLENLMPTLSGCPYVNDHTQFPSNQEQCHAIWEKFEVKGYRTVLSEEQFWFPIYKYMKRNGKGTHNTTYDNLAYIKGIQSTSGYALEKFGCFEHQMASRILSDRVVQVAKKLKGKLYYHHLWSVMTSHDVLGFTKYLDNPIYEMLTTLVATNLLENTVLILSSDHGTISSDYSRTAGGLIEARVPLLYFVFPDWFGVKYKTALTNLEINSKGLTSPYDVYETLNDLSDLTFLTDEALQKRHLTGKSHKRKGQSLFERISLKRSCVDAGIPDEYCICWYWTQLEDPKDIRIVKAVSFSLDYMNRVIDKNSKCTRLDLKEIHDGRITQNSAGDTIYEVTFETIPGAGIFGSTLKAPGTEGNIGTNEKLKFELVGQIERQNRYGKQSDCLPQDQKDVGWLRSICYCRGWT